MRLILWGVAGGGAVARWFYRLTRTRPRVSLVVLIACVAALYYVAVPAWGDWQARLAARSLRDERLDDARREIDRAVACAADRAAALRLAARIDRVRGEYAEAEKRLQECVKVAGGRSEETQLEWLLLRARRDDVDAVTPGLYQLVESGHPDSEHILETLSGAFMAELRLNEAHRCLHQWIELAPESAKAREWLGWVYDKLNLLEAAAREYRRAVELDPARKLARARLAELLVDQYRLDEARPHLEFLTSRYPDDSALVVLLARERYLEGNLPAARELLLGAVAADPENPTAVFWLGKLESRAGDQASAERHLREAVRLDPQNVEYLYALAQCLQLIGGRGAEVEELQARRERTKVDFDRIRTLLRSVSEPERSTAEELAEFGTLLLNHHAEQPGVLWLHRALARDPDCGQAHAGLAAYYEVHGEPALAARHRRRATGPAPVQP